MTLGQFFLLVLALLAAYALGWCYGRRYGFRQGKREGSLQTAALWMQWVRAAADAAEETAREWAIALGRPLPVDPRYARWLRGERD